MGSLAWENVLLKLFYATLQKTGIWLDQGSEWVLTAIVKIEKNKKEIEPFNISLA